MKNGRTVSYRRGFTRVLSLLLTFALLFGTLLPMGTAFAADADVTTLSCVTKGADGRNYRLTEKYGEDAAIPADAVLTASAIGEDDEERQWTVTVAEAAEGNYTFLIYKQGAEFTDGTPIRVDVTVDLGDIPDPETPSSEEPSSEEPSSEEPGTEESPGQEPTTGGGTEEPSGNTGGLTSFLQKLSSFRLRFTERMKRLFSYFGINL